MLINVKIPKSIPVYIHIVRLEAALIKGVVGRGGEKTSVRVASPEPVTVVRL